MPPVLALSLCIVGILILFRFDTRAQVSRALWIPTIWVLIMASRMVIFWFSWASPTNLLEDGNPIDRTVFIALMVAAVAILFHRRVPVLAAFRGNGWLFVFLLYCAFSVLWSDFPFVASKRYIKEIGNLLMAMVIWSERDSFEAIRTIIRRCTYILVPLSIVLIKYYPALGRNYDRWDGALSYTGVTTNKNTLGVLCLIGALELAWRLLSAWRNGEPNLKRMAVLVRLGMLSVTTWLLYKAHSATSAGCFVVGTLIMVALCYEPIRKRAAFFAGVVFVCLLMLPVLAIPAFSLVAELLGRDVTLTGRTDLWKLVLEIGNSPVLGVGFDSFWLGDRLVEVWTRYMWLPTQAHNGYLEIYLDLGIIGLLLLVVMLFSAFRKRLGQLQLRPKQEVFFLTILCVIVLHNITESGFFRPGQLVDFLFVLLASQPRPLNVTEETRYKRANVTQRRGPAFAHVESRKPALQGRTSFAPFDLKGSSSSH